MNRYIFVIIFMFALCFRGYCKEASFPEELKAGGTTLRLSGVGSLSKWFIKGCDIALYAEVDTRKTEVLDDAPRCLEFHYWRNIKAEQFAVAAWDTLRRSWSEDELAEQKAAIDKMHSIYRDVGKDDRYRLLYVPGIGTKLYLNGKQIGLVEGAEFAEVYYSIWLGKGAIDTKTRDKMLEGLK